MIHLLDPETGQVRNRIATGVGPQDIAVAGELAVVSNHGSLESPGFSLTVAHLGIGRVAGTVSLGRFQRPYGVEFLGDGRRVLVAAEVGRSVLVVNLQEGRVEKAIPVLYATPHRVAASPDGSRAYAVDRDSGRLSVLDLAESRLVTEVRLGRSAEDLAVSPDGQTIWVVDRQDNAVVVLDAGQLTVRTRLACRESPYRLAFTPDGRYVLVANTLSADLAVFDAGQLREVARIPTGWTAAEKESTLAWNRLNPIPANLALDPEGRRAYVTHPGADLVSVIDLEQWRVVRRWVVPGRPDGVAFYTGPNPGASEAP